MRAWQLGLTLLVLGSGCDDIRWMSHRAACHVPDSVTLSDGRICVIRQVGYGYFNGTRRIVVTYEPPQGAESAALDPIAEELVNKLVPGLDLNGVREITATFMDVTDLPIGVGSVQVDRSHTTRLIPFINGTWSAMPHRP